MLPLFAHPAGFWALLGLPAILAIHIFQQRSKIIPTSTLFLIGPLDPESRGGRSWDRLRSSRALWCQLVAVLLVAWLLSEPRWLRRESAQTVVAVVDSSASMTAFRDEAIKAVQTRFEASAGRTASTQWIVLTTDAREPALYRGTDLSAAETALASWRPTLGTHDTRPALRLATALAGANGRVWFITDTQAKVPPAQPTVGVGRPLANVGFAGVTVAREGGSLTWRALVQNYTDTPQRRLWWIENGANRGKEQTLDLAPSGLVELSGRFPNGEEHCTLALSPDEFVLDDKLPLVRPAARPLLADVSGDGEDAEFFRKVLASVDGVSLGSSPAARLRVIRTADTSHPAVNCAAIVLPPAKSHDETLHVLRDPVTAERDPLVDGLNWQGWLGGGPGPLVKRASDTPLLWQGSAPLVWLTGGANEARSLVLNLDWETTNAARLPATVLLVRRFVENVCDAQPSAYTANFDTNSPVALPSREVSSGRTATIEFTSVLAAEKSFSREMTAADWAGLRAPATAGFFTVRRGDEVLVRGAVQFSDPRQSNFRQTESFLINAPADGVVARERNTKPDPLTLVWVALLGGLLLLSWWPSRQAGEIANARPPVRANEGTVA